MTKETILSLLRSLLTIGGSYLVGHAIAGHTIDQDSYQAAGGAVLTVIGAVWGIVDKTTSIEAFQSAMRSSLQIIGSIGVAYGILKADTVTAILALIPTIVPAIQSFTSRLKVKSLDAGKLTTSAIGKVVPAPPKIS